MAITWGLYKGIMQQTGSAPRLLHEEEKRRRRKKLQVITSIKPFFINFSTASNQPMRWFLPAFLVVNNPGGHSEVPVAHTLIFILAHLADPPSTALEFALWTQRPMRSRSQRSREGLRRKPEGKTARTKSTLKLRNWKQGWKGRCYWTVRRLWWMGRAVNIFTEERY